jgi:two-component system response regulator RegX3
MKIMIVEDEASFSDALSFLLKQEGYEVVIASDGREALAKFAETKPDFVLLDVMIPEISGTEVCRTIRATSDVPIIMVTAKDAEIDRVVGLELGADDYVTKPYSSRELMARIKAVMRRRSHEHSASHEAGILRVGDIRMDLDQHMVTVKGISVSLPLKEFFLLEFLMRNVGKVMTRTQLIDRVWGSDYYGDTKTLDVHIKRLRAKVEADPANPLIIQTIRGLGYKLENPKNEAN